MNRTVLFLRHGHRTPARSTAADQANNGLNIWQSLLPSSDEIEMLSSRFVIKRDPSNIIPTDVTTRPFGCLTKRGLDYVRRVGDEFRTTNWVSGCPLYIQSTNYQRTQVWDLYCIY